MTFETIRLQEFDTDKRLSIIQGGCVPKAISIMGTVACEQAPGEGGEILRAKSDDERQKQDFGRRDFFRALRLTNFIFALFWSLSEGYNNSHHN